MAIKSVRILPERINPEWLEAMYENMTEQGQIEIDEFLSAQDLEIDKETGKVQYRRLQYCLSEISGEANVLFSDAHSERWDAKVSSDGTLTLTDKEGVEYSTLLELRPGEDCPADKHIIEIELVLFGTIIGF